MDKLDHEHQLRVVQLHEQERTRATIEKMRPLNAADLYQPLEHALAQTVEASAKVAKHLHAATEARLGD